MKRLSTLLLSLLAAVQLAPLAQAATYSLSDPGPIIKGCPVTVQLELDTEGANVLAGDTTINIDGSAVDINQVTIGTPLPMQVFNTHNDDEIKLSGARLPLSGAFNGSGVFGQITFTPELSSSSAGFFFSNDLTLENNMIDESIANVLTSTSGQQYNFLDRYNIEVDGIGFCTPDETSPSHQFVYPQVNASNVPTESNIVMVTNDDRAGVNPNSIEVSVDGVDYTVASPELTLTQNGTEYRIEIDPDADFAQSSVVPVQITTCDLNTPANCRTSDMNFYVESPLPPPAVCGDGIVNPSNGEQCDDGNTFSGDGCSAFCISEIALPDPSCTDGIQNQGETGIDCGPACGNVCATCNDGIQNQGEDGVDCGGPCQSCELVCDPASVVFETRYVEVPAECPVLEPAEVNYVRICHYDDDTSDPFALLVPEELLPDYLAAGDLEGDCPEPADDEDEEFELKPAAPQELVFPPISTPDRDTRIDKCQENFPDLDFEQTWVDDDLDGLSNRTECYTETSPITSDTDGDGCADGDELNRYASDPNNAFDCSVPDLLNTNYLVDPQNGWTLRDLNIVAGLSPINIKSVKAVAFPSEREFVSVVLESIQTIQNNPNLDVVELNLAKLQEASDDSKVFLNNFSVNFDYTELQTAFEQLDRQLVELETEVRIHRDSGATRDEFELSTNLQISLERFLNLDIQPVTVGSSVFFADSDVDGRLAKKYEITNSGALQDSRLYDLVSRATLDNEEQLVSAPVRFNIDANAVVKTPVPRFLGNVSIEEQDLADRIVPEANAQVDDGGMRLIEIDEGQPVISGESDFGAQVYAIWNSIVLNSSAVADSEAGDFAIQAPRPLEKGITHKVTVYAVKNLGAQKVRSDSVNVFFRIKDDGGTSPLVPIAATTAGAGVFAAGYYVIRLRIRRSL